MTPLRRLALVSVSWVGLIRFSLRLSSFVRTVILARLLTPADFGVYGIGAIVLGLTEMFTETGVNVVLIQNRQSDWTKYLNTVWVVSIARGVIITFFILGISPLVVYFFNSPESARLLWLLALVPFIRGFINPGIVQFQKHLRFDREFFFRTAIILVDAAVAIFTALQYQNALSLAAGLIAGAITEVLLSHLFISPRPAFAFNRPQAKEIIHQGKWMTGAGIFSFFAAKLPDIIIGKLIGTTALGYYQMAYRFAFLPTEEIIESVNRVAFPLYTSINQSYAKIKLALHRNLFILTLPAITWSIMLYLTPPEIIIMLLGQSWQPLLPLLFPLSLTAVVFALSAPPEPVMLALQKQRLLMFATLFRLLTTSLFILPLTLIYGANGTIVAITLALAIVLPYKWLSLKHLPNYPKAPQRHSSIG